MVAQCSTAMNHPSTNVTPLSLPAVLVIGGANMDIVAHTDTLLVRTTSNIELVLNNARLASAIAKELLAQA